MFIASLFSNARAVGVLLGGSGIGQTVAAPDVGALLIPRKPYAERDVDGSVSVASIDSLWQAGRHD